MREILFRAKDNAKEWRFGFLTAQFGYGVDDFDLQILTQACGELCYIDPETVGQYTGVKDKNGIKIFEGDIIKCGYQVWLICWIESGFWVHSTLLKSSIRFTAESAGKSEVIGNMYDNPELLDQRFFSCTKTLKKRIIALGGKIPAKRFNLAATSETERVP